MRNVPGSAPTRTPGAYAVSPDQQISLGRVSVLEPGLDAPVLGARGVHEPLAVLDADAAPDRLVAQRPVEVGPLEGLAYLAVRQRPAVRDLAEALAHAALDLHARRGEALGEREALGVDGAQGVEAVAGEGEEGANLVRAVRVRLVDDSLDAGPPQRHRGHRPGDAAAHDEGPASPLCLVHASSSLGPKILHRRSVTAQIKNARTPPPMGRTRVLWKAAKRHPSPSRTATRVWTECLSGEGSVLPRTMVPPVAWRRAM